MAATEVAEAMAATEVYRQIQLIIHSRHLMKKATTEMEATEAEEEMAVRVQDREVTSGDPPFLGTEAMAATEAQEATGCNQEQEEEEETEG